MAGTPIFQSVDVNQDLGSQQQLHWTSSLEEVAEAPNQICARKVQSRSCWESSVEFKERCVAISSSSSCDCCLLSF